MWNLIKKYWDLLSGTILGIISSCIVSFKLEKIQLIYSIIILILVSIGLFKVVRTSIDNKKNKRKKIIVDKLIESQSYMKAINMAQNPTKSIEEFGELIIKTTKGEKLLMKKLFTWIKLYWQQIFGFLIDIAYTCAVVYMYINDKFSFALGWLPQEEAWQIAGKVIFGIVSVLFVFISVRNKVKWVGVGSIEKAREYLSSLQNDTVSQLSDNAKRIIKEHLKILNKNAKDMQEKLSKAEYIYKDYAVKLNSLQELLNKGLGNKDEYNDLVDKVNAAEQEVLNFKNLYESLKTEISQYEEALK